MDQETLQIPITAIRDYSKYHKEYRNRPEVKIRSKEWSARPENKQKAAVKRKETRSRAFKLLGGAFCKRCSFSDERALQFDHINGDGAAHRREIGYAGSATCRAVLKDPDRLLKYQVLCANCNWIKRSENKEYSRVAEL